MPLAPELLDGRGRERVVEVLQVGETEHARNADGHIGIGAEVEVDLQQVGERREPRRRRRHVAQLGAEDGIDGHRQHVGDEHLLRQAHDEALKAHRHPFPSDGAVRQLLVDIVVADDGAGDELREKRDVEHHVQQIALRRHIAPVHVDDVGDGLERVERDAHGQRDAGDGHGLVDKLAEHTGEPLAVLEDAEAGKGHQNGDARVQLAPRGHLGRPDGTTENVGHDRDDDHEHHVGRLAVGVEQQARHHEHDVLPPDVPDGQGQQEHHGQKHAEKCEGTEDHGKLRPILSREPTCCTRTACRT